MSSAGIPWATIVTAAGALFGAALGLGSSVWLHWRNQRHEDRTRFHKERIEIYAKLIRASQKCRDAAYQSAPVLLPNAQPPQEASAATIARFNEAFDELMVTHGMVQLVASKPVEVAGAIVFDCARSVWGAASKGAEELNKQNKLTVMAETAFIKAAREELH